MKMKNVSLMGLLMLASVCFSCSSDDTPDDKDPKDVVTESAMNAVIATYVDKVVIPTYAEMEKKVSAMNTAVVDFLDDASNQTKLNNACDAWRAARKPWEQSEAFLYGPADYENLDPSLDSWPLDKDGIDQMLASSNFDEIEGDTEDAQGLRGFHTIEYLLFEEGQPRKVANVTSNEREYMKRVSARLLTDTKQLHKAWVSGLGTEEVPIPFGEEMKKHTSQRTSSARNVLGEFVILGGIQNIAGEVGDVKIGNPYNYWKEGKTETAVLEVESWYSWNSLTDYEDNIVSIENSYMGGTRDNRDDDTSLSALVRSVDKDLDTKVQAKISAAIKAIKNIPAPFRNNLGKATEIEAAMTACAEVTDVFDEVRTKLDLY